MTSVPIIIQRGADHSEPDCCTWLIEGLDRTSISPRLNIDGAWDAAELLAYTTGLEPPANRVVKLAAAHVALDFGDEVPANDAILWAFVEDDERRAFCAATGAIAWLA